MHKSISIYANALGCTPGHIRRYIREGKIPSAQLIRSRFGRPNWSITDCSRSAIADLKTRIAGQRRLRAPVTFQEPVPSLMLRESQDGKGVLGAEIIWQPMWRSLRGNDAVAAKHDVITRVALLSVGLSWHDIRNPNSTIDPMGRRRIEPLDQQKIQAFEENRLKWLRRWLLRDPTDSFTFEYDKMQRAYIRKSVSPVSEPDRKTLEKLLVDINRANIMQAAAYLALYHRRYSIPITYRTLARVLGVSKSSLYRQYGRELVEMALRSTRLAARSPTQGTISTRNELE
jgi:hypothetical protein